MRATNRMQQATDNTGWATFATILGMLATPHWVAQFGTSMLTLVIGLIVAHFVKRELNRRWPQRTRRRDKEAEHG